MKIFALIIMVLVVAVLAFAATQPDQFRVERSISIQAPPDKVFSYINDFSQWDAWSPWAKMDPAMKKTLSSPATGKGAFYEWEGNDKVGKGRMEIVAVDAPSQLRIKLDFLTPYEARNTAEFTLKTMDQGTQLTWAMYGPSPYLSKLMQVFISMDSMVGKDFEAGLNSIKGLAEK